MKTIHLVVDACGVGLTTSFHNVIVQSFRVSTTRADTKTTVGTTEGVGTAAT